MRGTISLGALAAWGVVAAVSCATYQDDLTRSQRAFEASEDERALAILRVLEPDTDRLSVVDRARYAYLRGMTDYHIGYRAEARHWLAIAATINHETPSALPPDWERHVGESLAELNEAVYSGGMASLGAGPSRGAADEADADSSSQPDAAPPSP